MRHFFFFFLIAIHFSRSFAQVAGDYRTNATGSWSWSTVANWQKYDGASWNAAPDYPGQNAGAETVTIQNNTQLTLDVSPVNTIGALTLSCTANNTNLTFAGFNLSVTGDVNLSNTATAGNVDIFMNVGAGTLNAGSVTMSNNTNGNYDCDLQISTGTTIVTGAITMNGAATENGVVFSSNGLLQVGGTMSGGSLTASTGTVEYNTAAAGNVGAYTYYNLKISTGAKTLGGNTTVSNNLDIASGSLDLTNRNFTVNGSAAITGTLNDSNNGGANRFDGAIIVVGTVSSANNSTWEFRSGITNNGTFSITGTGAKSFTTNSQSLDGNNDITMNGVVTVDVSLLNDNNANINFTSTSANALTGIGTWTQAANSTLNLNAASVNIAAVDFHTNTNTVDYNRSNVQTVFTPTPTNQYHHLTISGSNVKTLSGNITVNGNLQVSTSGTTTLACDVYQITGTAGGTINLDASTTLTLGNTGSATNILFPINFGTIILDIASAVTYQSSAAQTVSSLPSYGDLNILTGGTKTVNNAAAALDINGDLVVTSATLDLGTNITNVMVDLTATIDGVLSYNGTTTKSVTVTSDLSGAGTIDMSGGNLLHTLTLSGTNNNIGTLTTAAVSSIITYDANGTQQIFDSPNYRKLVLSGTNTKTITGGNVTVNNDLDIQTGVTLDPVANNLTVSGNTTIAGTLGDSNTGGTTSLQAVDLSGGAINGSATGTVNINGNLTMPSGDGTIGRMALTVNGSTTIATTRELLFNSNTGVKTFAGTVNINNTAKWTSTSITTTGNLIFQGGIINNSTDATSFSAGGTTFNTNNQNLAGSGIYTFGNQLTISGAITVTNQSTHTNGITFNSILDGTVGGSTWRNDPNTKTFYQYSAGGQQPMNTGTLDVSANGNEFHYSRGGNQNVKTPATGYYHLIISNSGTKTLQGNTTIDGTLSVNAGTLTSGGNDLSVTGTTTVASSCTLNGSGVMTLSGDAAIAGTLNPSGTANCGNIDLSDGTIGGAAGTVNLSGNLTMPAGDGTIDNVNITVNGTTTVAASRTLNITSTGGTKIFAGNVSISGVWSSAVNESFIFRGGIAYSGSGFISGTGTYTFNTNNQSITGNASFTILGNVSINDINLVNSNSATITIQGSLNGVTGGSSWEQDNGSTLVLTNATVPFNTTGFLNAYTAMETNTVKYSGASNATYVGTYSNLTYDGSGIATIGGAITVNGTLTLESAGLNNGSNLTMGNGATINRYNNGYLTAVPTFGASVNITYTGGAMSASYEMPTTSTVLNDLTLNVAGEAVTLNANVQANGIITFTSGILQLGAYDLTLAPAATFAGSFDNTHMVETNSTGKIIKQGTANSDLQITYPLGTGSFYTPMVISSLSATFGGTETISVRAVASREPNLSTSYNALNKYWEVASSAGLTGITVDANFSYINPNEVTGTQANYVPIYWNGAAHITPTGASAAGVNPFSCMGNNSISGNWTARDPNPATPVTYYTYQSGDWGTVNTWTQDPTGTTLVGPGVPGSAALDNVVILNGRTVTTSTSRVVGSVVINTGGTIDIGTSIGHNFNTISGGGTLKLQSTTLPSGIYTSFVSSSGGTIEYYDFGGMGTAISTAQTTYNNLVFSNSTGTNNTFILDNPLTTTTYTLNGSLTLTSTGAGTTTLQLANNNLNVIDLTINGNIVNGSNCYMTVGTFNAIHSVTIYGNLTNNGTIDFANNVQYSATANTGAVDIIFKGLSDNTLICNGQTDVYTLTLNKGTDQTYKLTATGSNSNYLQFYANGLKLNIVTGTFVLGNGLTLTRVSASNAQWSVPVAGTVGAFWLDGGDWLYGTTGVGLLVRGKFRVISGNYTIGDYGINIANNGEVSIEGGTGSIRALICGGSGASVGYFNMSGGTLNIDNSLGGSNITDLARFSMPNTSLTYIMTGGTINIKDPRSATYIENGGIMIGSSSANYNVTGGTWNVYTPASSVNFGISSTAPFYNLNIYKVGAGTGVAILDKMGGDFPLNAQPLVVLNDFRLVNDGNTPTFDANGQNITVGGNFIIDAGTSYLPKSNTTTFNGTGNVNFTINNTISGATNLVVNKTSGGVTMGGSSTFNALKGLTLTSGNFDIGSTNDLDVIGNIASSITQTGSNAIVTKRGVSAVSVTTGGSYSLPNATASSGGTGATFILTIKDGAIVDINPSAAGSGYSGQYNTITFSGGTGAGATAMCETSGGTIARAWILTPGSGYGPTATVNGGGGSGAAVEVFLTGVSTSGGSPTGSVASVNILAAGEDYTSVPTIAFSSGAATATATSGANTISGTAPVFSNLNISNNANTNLSVAISLTGNLRLNGILDASTYNIALGASGNIYDDLTGTGTAFGTTKMIKTSGNSSDGGVTKTYSSINSFIYPLGTGSLYTPGTLTFSTNAPTGSITMKPVAAENPLVTASGQSLTYYWKVVSSGFALNGATVTHTYAYDQSDVIDNGTTILEIEYVPGRYNPSSTTWTTNADMTKVDETTNTIVFDGASFNNTIDGEYTAGDQTPADPFSTVITYYSRGNGDWGTAATWSIDGTLKHSGVVGPGAPTSNSIVEIGDGTAFFHDITISSNTQSSGSLRILAGSSLDLATTTGHNFGTYVTSIAGEGTLKISSATSTAEFPAGDFANFLDASGGTVEYYSTGTQDYTIPAISAAPSSLSLITYKNITLKPGTGRFITTPDINLSVLGNMLVQGTSSTGIARLNAASAKNISIDGNLSIVSGNLQFRNGSAQVMSITGDVLVSNGAIFDVENAGATVHTLSLASAFTNNGTVDFNQASDCNVTFTGNSNKSFTGTATLTDINGLSVNKGTSQTPVLTIDVSVLTTPTNGWLTLTNGTTRFAGSYTLTISNTATSYNIPSTTCLSISNASANIKVCDLNNNNADLLLDGKLELINGTFVVGRVANGNNNDIEINSSGLPEINVQGGTLTINGQIRRGTTTTAGSLVYSQSGSSTVNINGRNINATRGVLEIVNAGSQFNMSGSSTLNILRGGATTFADLYLQPASSTITGGTLVIGSSTIGSQTITLNSAVVINNITIQTNNNTLQLLVNPLTINGNLTVGATGVFDANSFDVTIKGNLTNNNTTNTTGVTVGGYRPGISTQTTTFNSTTAGQSITGVASNLTNFGNLIIANTSSNVALANGGNSPIRVNGNLTISNPLVGNDNVITVVGNIANSSSHTASGGGKMLLQGSSQQTISGNGNGTFSNLELDNTSGSILSAAQTVNGTLTLTNGIFEIGSIQLTLGSGASVAGTFSSTKMIKLNGAIADAGIIKSYPASASNFTFPVGVTGKYTPAQFNVTANGAVGTITVRLVNTKHNSTQDAANKELTYYWNITSTGFSGLTVNHTYTYEQTDVNGTETSYVGGRFYNNDWDQVNIGAVNSGSNTIDFTGVGFLDGDYTGGESTEFIPLLIYYSRNASSGGNWNDVNSWSTDAVLQHAGAAALAAPAGNAIVIALGHTINANGDLRTAASMTVTGTLDLGNYIGHNFGTVDGIGTIKINATAGGSFIFPAGTYTSFMSASGGTVEFGGATNGTLPTQTTFNNVVYSGSSTKTIPAVTYTFNGDVSISGGVLRNNVNNSAIIIKGDWINNAGAGGFLPGTSTTTFSGSSAQQITNAAGENFHNLTVSNTSGDVTLNNNVTISNTLNFTNGKIIIGNNNLYISSGNAITGASASSYVVTNGFGFLGINSVTGARTYPVGSSTSSYTPASITNGGASDRFDVRVFNNVFNGDGYSTNQITADVVDKTWDITEGVAGGSDVTLTLQWNAVDELSFNRSNCGIAHFTGGTYDEPAAYAAASGSNPYTRSRSGINSFSPFAVEGSSSPLPIELTSFEASYINPQVELVWVTETETNNDYFVIEKTRNGENFEELTRVNGKGTTSVKNYYSAQDPIPYDGISYYRLKQVDFNGAYTYSKLIAVNANSSNKMYFILFPNPCNEASFAISLFHHDLQGLTIKIYDVHGKQVDFSTNVLDNHSLRVFPNYNLAAGMYQVVVSTPASVYTQKLLVN